MSAIAGSLAHPLAIRSVLLLSDEPPSAVVRFGPWIFAALGLSFVNGHALRIPAGVTATNVLFMAFSVVALVLVSRTYRRSNAILRRQIRWVVLGFYAGLTPIAAVTVLAVADRWLLGEWLRFHGLLWLSLIFAALIPASLLFAIARYNLFDIDRLLSAAASYNLVIVVLVGAGLVAVPWFGDLSSRLLGVDPRMGQVALSLALAAVVVPAHRRLRPRIDRIFFKERQALELGIAELLRSLSACEDTRALTRRVGEELQRLLRPQACVVYARAGEAFGPVFVEGRAVPPAFEAASPLVATLAERRKPLALSAAGRTPDAAELGPFDRAALQTLDAEVVVPVHRDALAAFLCLGPKRSGDVYTSTDLSHLTSVAEAVSSQLRRFDQEDVIREAHAMQERLRRYVPGVVAEELATRDELASGEREVSVLFVDLRGYTGFAETRRAEEIFSTVNSYTETVSAIVRAQGGSVVEFNGDGMMAVFGAPRDLPGKERAAVAAGREIVGRVGQRPVRDAQGAIALSVGVGIATGLAFVGNIRAADRMIWSAIGNTTNLAARLQALTRELDASIVIDAATFHAVGPAATDFHHQPALAIRGRRAAEDVYTLPLEAHPASARTASIESTSSGPLSGR